MTLIIALIYKLLNSRVAIIANSVYGLRAPKLLPFPEPAYSILDLFYFQPAVSTITTYQD